MERVLKGALRVLTMETIESILIIATRTGYMSLVERFLIGVFPEEVPLPDLQIVNEVVRAAASGGESQHLKLLKRLLTGQYPRVPLPDKKGMELAVNTAGIFSGSYTCHQDIIEYLLNGDYLSEVPRPYTEFSPPRYGVVKAAASGGEPQHLKLLKRLLTGQYPRVLLLDKNGMELALMKTR